MYKVGDMVRVVKEEKFDGFGRALGLTGKAAIILDTHKRTYILSYWVKFFDGFECWVDEEDLTILSSCSIV
jgi:hypothetical protein